MRTFILLFVFLSFSLSLIGQINYEYVSHIQHGRFNALDVDQEGNVVAAGSSNSCPLMYVTFYDSLGNQKWEKGVDTFIRNRATDVFFDVDGNIIVVGPKSNAVDIGSPQDGIYLVKLGRSGQILSSAQLALGSFLNARVLAAQLSDSTYITAVYKKFSRISADGDSLLSVNLEVDKIIDLEVKNDSSILILSKAKAVWLDKNGVPFESLMPDGEFVAASQKGDTTWILGSENILRFTNDFSNPAFFPFQSEMKPEGMTPRRNRKGVLIWGKQEDKYRFFHFSEGVWTKANVNPVLGTQLLDVKNEGDYYFFAGADLWEQPPKNSPLRGGFISAATEGYGRTTEISSDIGIESISIELINHQEIYDEIYVADTLLAFGVKGKFEGKIDVLNQGASVVKNLVVFSEWLNGFNCGELRFFEVFDSLNIQPGATHTVSFQFRDYDYFYTGVPESIERCFYIAAPNNTFDQVSSNNSVCAMTLTPTQEPKLSDAAIKVFPNPITSRFWIESVDGHAITAVTLYNLAGQQQQITMDLQHNRAIMHRAHLPNGLYFLRIQTEGGFASRKIIFR